MELGGISSAYAEYLQNQNTAETKLKETIDGTDYANATGGRAVRCLQTI